MAVGTCCTRSSTRSVSHPSAGPDDHAAGDREQEGRRNGGDGEAVGRDGADGEPVDQQRARVVQQALAFEDRQDAMRRPQLAEHGGCGDGVGRSDDGAERNRRRPRHRRDERAGDDGDGGGRESDREDDQARDRRPVVLEIPERRVVRRVEQDGGDEQRQRQLGGQRERRRRGTNASSAPPSARNTGYGAPTRRAPAARTTAATKRPRSCSSSLISPCQRKGSS